MSQDDGPEPRCRPAGTRAGGARRWRAPTAACAGATRGTARRAPASVAVTGAASFLGTQPDRAPRGGRARRADRRRRRQARRAPPGTRRASTRSTSPSRRPRRAARDLRGRARRHARAPRVPRLADARQRPGRTSSRASARCTCSYACRRTAGSQARDVERRRCSTARTRRTRTSSPRTTRCGLAAASPFFADKIEAEAEALRFANAPGRGRRDGAAHGAASSGPTVQNFVTRYLSRRVVPTMMGFDPLVQFVHEVDAIAAFKLAIDRDLPGVVQHRRRRRAAALDGDQARGARRAADAAPHRRTRWCRPSGSRTCSEAPPASCATCASSASPTADGRATCHGLSPALHDARGRDRLRERAAAARRQAARRRRRVSANEEDGADERQAKRADRESRRRRAEGGARLRAARRAVRAGGADATRAEPSTRARARGGHELGIGSRVLPPTPSYGRLRATSPSAASERARTRTSGAQIRALEARLDGLIRGGAPAPASPACANRSSAAQQVVEHLHVARGAAGGRRRRRVDTARELLSTDFYLRQWGRLGMRNRSEEVDDFGLDPDLRGAPATALRLPLRSATSASTPTASRTSRATGRCIARRQPLGHAAARRRDAAHGGAARAPGPARRALARRGLHLPPALRRRVHEPHRRRARLPGERRAPAAEGRPRRASSPKGSKGIGKLFRDRYQLQRFGRGGFIRLALRTQTPIVPCAIVGAEETNPMLFRIESLSKALGAALRAGHAHVPALGPARAPAGADEVAHRVRRTDPLRRLRPRAPRTTTCSSERLAERVRATIQGMLDERLATRKSVWFG